MRATRSHGGDELLRQPVALGADQQRDGAPPAIASGPRSGSPRVRRPARSRSPGSSPTSLDARERDGEDRAHARPHRLRRVRVGAAGPERDARRAEGVRPSAARCRRCRGRRRRAGRRTAARRARPSAARRRRSRACPSRAWRRSRARQRSTSWKSAPPSSRAGQPVALERRASGRARRRRAGPRPRPGTCPRRRALAPGRAAGAAPSGGGSVVEAIVGHVVVGSVGRAGSGNKKGAVLFRSDAREAVCRLPVCRRAGSGSRRLAGDLGKTSEGVGVAHGDVGEHLAVELDAGQLEAVHELRVAHAVLARGGVDARDPQAAEVALAVAPVAVGVGVGLQQRLLGALVVRVRLAAEALRQLERRAALLARVRPSA